MSRPWIREGSGEMHVVLYEPEIPFNTGAIGRTCVASRTALHLIKPYGFRLNDRYLKRAGMDYWNRLELYEYLDYGAFLKQHPELTFATSACPAPSALPDLLPLDADSLPLRPAPDSRSPRLWFASTKAWKGYSEVSFGPEDYIMFGPESAGIPEAILFQHPESCIRIPMQAGERSLNLSNSVSIVLYEALRQNGFPGLG